MDIIRYVKNAKKLSMMNGNANRNSKEYVFSVIANIINVMLILKSINYLSAPRNALINARTVAARFWPFGPAPLWSGFRPSNVLRPSRPHLP